MIVLVHLECRKRNNSARMLSNVQNGGTRRFLQHRHNDVPALVSSVACSSGSRASWRSARFCTVWLEPHATKVQSPRPFVFSRFVGSLMKYCRLQKQQQNNNTPGSGTDLLRVQLMDKFTLQKGHLMTQTTQIFRASLRAPPPAPPRRLRGGMTDGGGVGRDASAGLFVTRRWASRVAVSDIPAPGAPR